MSHAYTCLEHQEVMLDKLVQSYMDFNRYDLVDLTRQSLAKYANQIFLKIIQSYKSNNISQVTTLCECFLDLVNDLDMLLASHEGFLLGPWLESAKGLARDEEQEIQVIPFIF